jgi:molybdate transport system substrate-binding protein
LRAQITDSPRQLYKHFKNVRNVFVIKSRTEICLPSPKRWKGQRAEPLAIVRRLLQVRSTRMTLPRLGFSIIALFLSPAPSSGEGHAAGSDPINIYAAASFAEALRAAIARYPAGSARKIALTPGQSADFAKKIEDGAPASIFVSASKKLVAGLAARGLINRDAVASPVGNSLVLVAPANSPLKKVTISPDTDFASMLGPEGSLAIADPDYMPLGIYAMAALSKLGKWNAVAPRLARASSVQAALELVENGRAQLGITFSTSAAGSVKVKVLGHFPSFAGIEIRYTFAIIKKYDGPETRKLFDFLAGPDALRIYAGYGFVAMAGASN